MGAHKPRGILAARKLANKRRLNRWADKNYRKAHTGREFRWDPLGGSSHASGICNGKVGFESKQPNSALRKGVRILLKKNSKKIMAFVPGDGTLNFIDENDTCLVSGLGRKGRTVGDMPAVRYQVVSVAGLSLKALYLGKKQKKKA